MNELIPIEINENQEPVVSGRMLHEFLEVETPFHIWFPRMQEYGFEENIDFCTKMFKSTGGRPSTDYLLKIDMAKELCMIQRTPKGKQARQYFLRIEKEFNSPQKVMARALLMADKQLHCLKLEVKELKPKALFADAVQTSHTSILIGELAKLLKQNGVDTGQRRLFQWMRDNGYLMKSGSSRNMPTQYSMERGLFEIKESTVSNPDGSVRVTKTPKVTGKGQIYFVNKFIKQVS